MPITIGIAMSKPIIAPGSFRILIDYFYNFLFGSYRNLYYILKDQLLEIASIRTSPASFFYWCAI